MTSRTRLSVLVAGLAGIGFSGASAWVHHSLLTDPNYTSFCDVNATFNCSQVYLSQYGSFQGVSTALFGLIWFGVATLIAAFAAAPAADAKVKAVSPAGAYLFAWGTIGLAVILYLAYASFFVLGTACLLCMGTYVCVAIIFLMSGLERSVSVADLPGRIGQDLGALRQSPAALAVTLMFVAGSAGLLAFFPKDTLPKGDETSSQATPAAPAADARAAFIKQVESSPRVDVGVPADGAKVVIVKFNDYQCPACREGHTWHKPVLEKFEQSHPGMVRFVVKDYPLEGECNYAVPTGTHYAACEAASARRMAVDVGKQWEMDTWLFANQARLTADVVKEGYTAVTGRTDFDARYPAVMQTIRQDVADGVALQINQTPTYFVNGIKVLGNLQPQWLEVLINYEIEKAGGK